MSSEPSDSSHVADASTAQSLAGRWILFLLQPKVAIPLLVVLSLIMAPLVYRGMKLSRVPPADEPFDTKSVLKFVVPDIDNAFVEYRAASGMLVKYTSDGDEFDKAQDDGWEHATEPVRKWLDANRPFMEVWRRGTAKPDAQYFRAGDVNIFTLIPAVHDAREFARLVRLEASRLLAERKTEESWEWLRTSFRMSRHLGRHGWLLERLVGIAAHATASEGMVRWANEPQTTAELLRRAMRELQDEQKRTPPLSNCLKIEYLSMTSLMQSPTLVSDLGGIRFRGSPFLDRTYLFVNGEPELSEHVIRYVFANWLAQVDKPRLRRTKQEPTLGVFEPDPTILKPQPTTSELSNYFRESILARLELPAGRQMFIVADREAARDTVLLTVLALELFAREHGHYPEKLEELVPDFLPAVPEDNHAPPKTPLRYKRDADGALIYSVGDNGTDDGGRFAKPEDIGYRLDKPPAKGQE